MNMQDDYSKISQYALEEKKQKALEKWIKEKVPTYYVMVDGSTLQECPLMQKFTADKKTF